jgi:two-component system, OmpR family, sensor histidine kinase KdpD
VGAECRAPSCRAPLICAHVLGSLSLGRGVDACGRALVRRGYAQRMKGRSSSLLLRDARPPLALGLAAGLAAVALTTLAVYPLRTVVPPVSTGVVYLLGVLLVSTFFGAWPGLATAVGSALAFNWFHLPPTGRFTIADEENWVALGVFLVAAVVVSTLAELARARASEAEQRRREADLAADLARLLLGGPDVRASLAPAAERLAAALDLPSAALDLPSAALDLDAAHSAADALSFPLRVGDGRVATLRLGAEPSEAAHARLRERVLPSLEALLAAALDREALQREVVETQALRRSDDIKTALLRAVSHDLRSPLTAIGAVGEALASSSLTAGEREELAASVVEEASRLSQLVDKLLDLSRLQGGAADPRTEWCSIEEVLRAAIDETPHAAGWSVGIDPELPLIRADAAQLERAFANLLENAARHGGEHPVAVRARVVGHRVLVRIVDRGPGIAERERERIFEPFYRSPATADDGHVGSGLGLAVVRGFVEANGGRVWVESLPGQGTTFVVELPLPVEAPVPAESR